MYRHMIHTIIIYTDVIHAIIIYMYMIHTIILYDHVSTESATNIDTEENVPRYISCTSNFRSLFQKSHIKETIFCKRDLNVKGPANRSHPIALTLKLRRMYNDTSDIHLQKMRYLQRMYYETCKGNVRNTFTERVWGGYD